jgi:plastocyanin
LLLAAAGVLAWALSRAFLGTPIAKAADTWNVQVSGSTADMATMAQAFFPDPLIIHVGDTVKWTWADTGAPHSVTFNSGKPELPIFVPGPATNQIIAGPAFFPMGPASPVSYDGTAQLNSGPVNPGGSYTVTFTRTGIFGYVCSFHPGMRGQVEVREAGAPLPESPAQATTRGQATGAYLLSRMQGEAAHVQSASAGGVHTSAAGLGDTLGATALAFLPTNITVARGDTVAWVLADPFEVHTITFLSGAAAPDLLLPQPQPSGPPLLVLNPAVAGPGGGNTYTGQGIVNSGIIDPGNGFVLKFDAPPGTYTYTCLIHPTMKSTVTVTG